MLFTPIKNQIDSLEINSISKERKFILQPLIDFIQDKINQQKDIKLNFICTHNSRRSHLSQVWAQVMARYFNIENVTCFSGGTEATAMYPMSGKVLEKSGFKIDKTTETSNPIYHISYAENANPTIAFSKTFDDAFNPKSEFSAILTCSHADENCPFIAGAEKRIPITYEDPKAFDNTPLQGAKYLERSLQIATEMKFVFSQLKK
ncbi:MAG: protein-tyrosine-phosphatase [Flavobacteriaceae bacterium]|nr:MAG: protein-tyrosine-phosphatase [Flavobacteriaceae bacterium]